jgi:hypothetical protein
MGVQAYIVQAVVASNGRCCCSDGRCFLERRATRTFLEHVVILFLSMGIVPSIIGIQ